MKPDWSPPPLHGARARRTDARISGVMTVLGSLTAVPFATQAPVPAPLLTFATVCSVWGVLMVLRADRLVPWMLTGASMLGAVGITSVAVHAPEGATFATGPILYVIPVLQVGLLRGRREAWSQLAWTTACYVTGLAVVGLATEALALTALPVVVTLAVLNVAVTWLRTRIEQLVREVDRLFRELREQAERDPLTGLLNRGGMVRAAARTDVLTEGTVVLLDVDHFKDVNDAGGHLAGDELLRDLGAVLREVPRHPEMAVRVGGEEFLLVLRGTDPRVARERAEALRRHVSATLRRPDGAPVTVSLGVACGTFTSFDDLYRRADDALYRAKHRGRDRVELAPAGSAAPQPVVPAPVRASHSGRSTAIVTSSTRSPSRTSAARRVPSTTNPARS